MRLPQVNNVVNLQRQWRFYVEGRPIVAPELPILDDTTVDAGTGSGQSGLRSGAVGAGVLLVYYAATAVSRSDRRVDSRVNVKVTLPLPCK